MFFRSADTLYGRYWGAEAEYHSLHFETCYHQGIDYCIEHGLASASSPERRVNTSWRAALRSTATWSAHWIADAPLRRAIGAYLAREALAVKAYASEVQAHAPFKDPSHGSPDELPPP